MALNLDAIRKKLDSLQNQTKKQDALWKPEPGKQQVRIVPYKHNKDNPFLELYFHYDFGKKTILSPMTYGRPDPIVDFAEKLKVTGNSDDWKLGKKLEPKMRCYVPVLVRGKEHEGVKFWGFGKQVFTEILGFIADPDYGDVTDPTNGRDIVVEFVPADSPGSFPKTTIRVKPNTSPITDDKAVLAKLQETPDINSIFKEPTYDELKGHLEAWLNPSEDANAQPNAAAEDAPVASSAKTSAKVSKVDDVSSAFDELFNEN
jgi:hypothetical protein